MVLRHLSTTFIYLVGEETDGKSVEGLGGKKMDHLALSVKLHTPI